MKKEVKHIYNKAIDSLTLSVELFNRPYNCGRIHGVLIFLDHSFEMLLKAAILHKGGKIRERRAKETIGFSACIRKAFSDAQIKFLNEEEVLILQTINGFRDAAQHYTLEISEQLFYIQAQAGLTLFRDVTERVFGIDLKIELPTRVLPLSTTPPMDMAALFNHEVEEVKKLLLPTSRRKLEALEKLRALAIMENSIQGIETQPSDSELKVIATKLKQGLTWDQVFPGTSTINLTSEGHGISFDLRITKTEEGIPFTPVPEGTPGAAVVAIKRVNELDFYNLTLTNLCDKTKVGQNKLLAVIKELGIQDDKDAFKAIKLSSQTHKRYSPKALERLKKELPQLDIEEVWRRNRPKYKSKN
ncbi:MAG TPA: hypothetical protein PLL94_03030 [Bacteroidales bacterium]|jgi:hypothetical protein|nr:hypothetical protein [Bacteroidales bacterium]